MGGVLKWVWSQSGCGLKVGVIPKWVWSQGGCSFNVGVVPKWLCFQDGHSPRCVCVVPTPKIRCAPSALSLEALPPKGDIIPGGCGP